MSNPYQSPTTETEPKPKPSSLMLRVLAVVSWILGLAPTLSVINSLLTKGSEALTPSGIVGFSVLVTINAVLPAIAFGLLGLGSWRRSWPLVVAGALMFLADFILFGLLIYFTTIGGLKISL